MNVKSNLEGCLRVMNKGQRILKESMRRRMQLVKCTRSKINATGSILQPSSYLHLALKE